MKISYIHSSKKVKTGAGYINSLIVASLRRQGAKVKDFYPKFSLSDTPIALKGTNNILFFYSLMESRDQILKADIIQGTTYTPLAFLRFNRPVVSHFGSTTYGFLRDTPRTKFLEDSGGKIINELKRGGIISELNLKSRRPQYDIAIIEKYAAERADCVIATSEIVRQDLLKQEIPADKIVVIHNAIEDYWFAKTPQPVSQKPKIVFLGRIGEDVFTLKLKGIDRLVNLYRLFPDLPKTSIIMTRSKKLISWLQNTILNHQVLSNILKNEIPDYLASCAGDIFFLTSRYEGFSLSLIEAISQGLIPVAYPVGVVPEIIKSGENGFIVNNLAEAQKAVQTLIDNPDLRKKMSQAARQTATNFEAAKMAKKMLAVYEKIIPKK
ncbi:MAG: glycosyltransferase family 4 protein [Candidatus Parcubacteria bacterium]|nr:MAG: hypothetical protein JST_4420 [Candidatus Parcubacteria bacterium]